MRTELSFFFSFLALLESLLGFSLSERELYTRLFSNIFGDCEKTELQEFGVGERFYIEMEIGRTLGATGPAGRSQSVSPSKVDVECCRSLVKFRKLFFFVTCSLLLTVVFMAVDQFSHLPRFSTNDGAAYYKQSYKQSYNHGANRGPHLGQKPRSTYGDNQSKSRKLLTQVDESFLRDSSVKLIPTLEQGVSRTVPLN